MLAASAAPFSLGPASSRTLRVSLWPSSFTALFKSSWPRLAGKRTISTPAFFSFRALEDFRDDAVNMSKSSSSVFTIRDFSESRKRASRTTRNNLRRRGRPLRSVSNGSSARIVPIPVRSASGVIAGFEIDVECCAPRFFACRFQGDNFGVIAPIVLMKAFADNFAVADDHAADQRIWAGESNSFACQRKRVLQEANVVFVHGLVEEGINVGFGVEGNEVVNLFAGADEANRQAKLARNRDDDAAFRRAVELCQNNSGDADGGSKFARLGKAVLACGCVHH